MTAGLILLVGCLGSARAQGIAPPEPSQPLPPAVTAPAPSPAAEPPPPPDAAVTPDKPAEAVGEAPPAEKALAPPADAAGQRAYAVLETHCARCHQAGRLKRPAPAAAFGNILRLDELAADPHWVIAGSPDASRLYTLMLRRQMPFDVHQEQSGGVEPSVEEIQSVRAWISGLAPAAKDCRSREPVTSERIAEAIAKAAEASAWDVGRQRFVSIAHLWNDCHDETSMFAWRQALTRLFNSLSWRPTPVVLHPIDPQRTVFRLDIGQLGWLPVHWDRIMQAGGYVPGRFARLPDSLNEQLGTKVALVRADWLASTAMRAPLYYDLMGLPEIGAEVLKILQVEGDAQRRSGSLVRSAVRTSEFSRSGRLLERTGSSRGMHWMAFDVVKQEGQRDPADAVAAAGIPPHDAALALFSLPNGFPAFYILSQRGQRLDRAPAELHRRSVSPRGAVRVGLDCLACHGGGPLVELPAASAGTGMTAAGSVSGDRTTVRAALRGAGVDPEFRLAGVEPLVALSRQFTRPVSLTRLAAEIGVTADDLAKLAEDAASPVAGISRRLQRGLVPRAEVEAELPALMGALKLEPPPFASLPAGVIAEESGADPGPQIELQSDKRVYAMGDALSLTVRTTADCNLTLVSVDKRGRGTVIFPSDFEQNNLLAAGRTLKLPGDNAPYSFRVREKGHEQVVAVCSPAGSSVDGIRHDFERQRFTDLGDYSTFLTQALEQEQQERLQLQREAAQAAAASQADPKAAKARPRPSRADAARLRPKAEQVVRTAITIEIN